MPEYTDDDDQPIYGVLTTLWDDEPDNILDECDIMWERDSEQV